MDFYGQMLLFLVVVSPLQAGQAMRCACTEDLKKCASIHENSTDFQRAQGMCRSMGGELIKAGSKASNDSIAALLSGTTGYFWSGVDPKVTCSNNSSDAACAQSCMAVSDGKEWTETPCEGKKDGFLCEGFGWDSVCLKEKNKKVIILDPHGCSLAPCEHHCENVRNGYTCQCFNRFTPKRANPRHCEVFCQTNTCKGLCYGGDSDCYCPEGFVRDETNCTDIDECGSNHDCAQRCINTIGGYECACLEGYTLVKRTECVPSFTTPEPVNSPSLNYTTGDRATASTGEYVGIVVFIVLMLLGLLLLARYFIKRKSDEGLKDCDVLDQVQQEL